MQMKYIVVIAITLVALLLMLIKRQHRVKIIISYLFIMILLNIVINVRVMPLLAPFYHPYKQTFYQPEFYENGEFPDAFVPLLVKGKTITTKNDPLTIDESVAEGKDWLYAYYHVENASRLMELYGAKEVINDENLNGIFIPDDKLADFHDLGYANDMFRNSFVANTFWEELGNYFTYYWYYYEYLGEMHVYINPTGISEADELVLIWDGPGRKENEDFYLMTKEYFETKVMQ